jgi:hypothetical protein
MMFAKVVTLEVTPFRINRIVRNTKYPAARAPAIGAPTSPMNDKISI